MIRRALLAALAWHVLLEILVVAEPAVYAAADLAEPLLRKRGIEW